MIDPMSQRDPRWSDEVLGQPTGHTKTIGNWGCLLVVYNMLAVYYGLSDALPDEYNAHMAAMGCFKDQYMLPAAFRTAHPEDVDYRGYISRSSPVMLSTIDDYLEEGLLVPARVDFKPSTEAWEQHWVLIVDKIDDDYVIADPWIGEIVLLSEVYGIPGVDVLEAIFYDLM